MLEELRERTGVFRGKDHSGVCRWVRRGRGKANGNGSSMLRLGRFGETDGDGATAGEEGLVALVREEIHQGFDLGFGCHIER